MGQAYFLAIARVSLWAEPESEVWGRQEERGCSILETAFISLLFFLFFL
jgi:hypothetical protein